MKTHQHILLAVTLRGNEDDFLITQAQAMAQKLGAKLTLIHAVEPISNYGVYPTSKIENLESQLQEAAQQKMTELAEKFAIPQTHQIVQLGKAKTVIPEYAEEINADLIMVGSPQRHELELLLLGSTAHAILERAPCDVLAVRIKTNS